LSKDHGKFIIGLTGNIATGKSVVRGMLEDLGAYTIDADAIAHRVMAKGAPGYRPVVRTFGRGVLQTDGEIDRAKLGKLVFRDAVALARLEEIVHPLVRESVGLLIKGVQQPVVVIEAIKLFEGELRKLCNSFWVTCAPRAAQIERLTRDRGMPLDEALQRMNAQGTQAEKISAADVVIRNTGTPEALWRQVNKAWRNNVPVRPTTATAPPGGKPVGPAASA
jgi:dephospho-CoA kinase